MARKESLRNKPLCSRQRQRRASIDLSYPSRALPHRRTRKTLIEQHARRSQRIAIGNKGRKATRGVSAISPVKPDFVALHDHPIHCSGHVRARPTVLHCAMLTARDSFARGRREVTSAVNPFMAQQMMRAMNESRARILFARSTRVNCGAALPAGRTE